MDPHVWQVMVDAFPQLLFKGITVTIPLTIISFALSMVIAVVVALIQYSKVPVLRQICRFYVWVIRGTGAVAKFTEFQRVLPAPLLLVNLRENCF